MIISTFATVADSHSAPVKAPVRAPVKAPVRAREENVHRLLAVIAGGEEFLLRPEFIRGVYTIPVEYLSSDLSYVPTPEGIIPSVSLAEHMALTLGFCPQNEAAERTVIVFHFDDRSVALRVHAVSRPIVVENTDIFPLPALAHPTDTSSFLDSVAVLNDKNDTSQKRIGLVINPMVVLGFFEMATTLCCSGVDELASIKSNRERDSHDLVTRNQSQQKNFALANSALLAFSPRTPLPDHLFFRFCLPMSVVAAVLHDEPYTSLPTASSILRGFLIWRSKPVPVIDLAMAFGATEEQAFPTQPGRFLIARLPGGQFVALSTELSIQMKRTPKSTSVSYPAIASYPNLGVFPHNSELLVLPDVNRILGSRVPQIVHTQSSAGTSFEPALSE